MTFFEHVASVEDRALALPNMKPMLERIHRFHESLNKTIVFERVWRGMSHMNNKHSCDRYYAAALNAGFIAVNVVLVGNIHHVQLTDKGRAVIGAELPFYKREYTV